MKRTTFIVFTILLSLQIFADDYELLLVSDGSITIGNRICKKGDSFNESEEISWKNDNQAFKARNLRTKQLRTFAARMFSAQSCKSIKDYYIKNNHLSTRGNIASLRDLAQSIPDTIVVLDTISIESPFMLSDNRSFRLCIDSISVTMPYQKDIFYICREMLPSSINECKVAIEYVDSAKNKVKCVKKDILLFLPDIKEE